MLPKFQSRRFYMWLSLIHPSWLKHPEGCTYQGKSSNVQKCTLKGYQYTQNEYRHVHNNLWSILQPLSLLQCIRWARLQLLLQSFLLRSWLCFSPSFLFRLSSSKATTNHKVSFTSKQTEVGDPSNDRGDFCSLLLPGLHPEHLLLGHSLEQLSFNYFFFLIFSLFL